MERPRTCVGEGEREKETEGERSSAPLSPLSQRHESYIVFLHNEHVASLARLDALVVLYLQTGATKHENYVKKFGNREDNLHKRRNHIWLRCRRTGRKSNVEVRSHQLQSALCWTYNKAVDDCGYERPNKPLPSFLWGQFDEPSSTKKEP